MLWEVLSIFIYTFIDIVCNLIYCILIIANKSGNHTEGFIQKSSTHELLLVITWNITIVILEVLFIKQLQVFPGSPTQCERALFKAVKGGEMDTVEKLVKFYKCEPSFVNATYRDTGLYNIHF